MPDVLDLIEPGTLDRPPPRRLPVFFLPNLVGEYLLDLPLRAFLSLFVIICLAGALALTALGAPAPLSLTLLALAALRLLRPALRLFRNVREDYLLLRDGLVVTGHVLGVRPCYDSGGNLAGAFLDCAIPLTRQRTSVGSLWIADANEAMRLSAAGRLTVICLPRAPGTWRQYRAAPAPSSQPDEGA